MIDFVTLPVTMTVSRSGAIATLKTMLHWQWSALLWWQCLIDVHVTCPSTSNVSKRTAQKITRDTITNTTDKINIAKLLRCSTLERNFELRASQKCVRIGRSTLINDCYQRNLAARLHNFFFKRLSFLDSTASALER